MLLDPKWKDKYPIIWCDLCGTAAIKCPKCNNVSCNGSSCPECHEDSVAFNKCKTTVEAYLTEEEQVIYNKALRIRSHILDTLARGDEAIDWEKLGRQGQLSTHDMQFVCGWSPEKIKEVLTAYEASHPPTAK